LFQNTNATNTGRDDVVKGESLGDSILAFLGVGNKTPALAVA